MLPLLVITGPTATGKSKVGVEVAGLLDGEIISADSMQVYTRLDIGTAKLIESEKVASNGKYIPHFLMDIVPPDADFSVADFQRLAVKTIVEITTRGHIPLLVGGTGLYINAVMNRNSYRFTPQKTDSALRQLFKEQAEKEGSHSLYAKLAAVDPLTAAKLHPHDLKRVIRALEVYHLTGKPISYVQPQQEITQSPYRLNVFGLYLSREKLYQRINQRVDEMIAAGLVAEVSKLLEEGYSPRLNAMRGLGYKQISGYLTGEYSLEEAIRLLKRDTRHLAKRQLTWFRRDPRIRWLDVEKYHNSKKIAEEVLALSSRTIDMLVEYGEHNV